MTAPTETAPVETTASDGTLGWRATLLVLIVITALHSLSPSVQIGDSRLSVPASTQLVEHGTLNLEHVPEVLGLKEMHDLVHRNGALLPFFPWPPMLLAVPGVLVAEAVGKDPAGLKPSDPNQTWIIEIPTASLLVAITGWILALITFDLTVGAARRRRRFAVGVAFIFAFSTAAWSTASRALWQHTPSILLLALALLLALRIGRSRWHAAGLGAALAGAYLARPPNAVSVVLFFAWLLISHRRFVLPAVAGALAVAAGFVAVNLAAYGSLLPPYYDANRLGTGMAMSLRETLVVYLVSPSRGLLIYDPIVFLALAGLVITVRRTRISGLQVVAVLAVIGQWLVVGRYGSTGGASYGPRLMSDTIPYFMFLAIPALVFAFLPDGPRRSAARVAALWLTIFVIAWGVVINAPGALLRSAYCWSTTPHFIDDEPSHVWDWSDPQFLRPLQDVDRGDSLHQIVVGSCRPSAKVRPSG